MTTAPDDPGGCFFDLVSEAPLVAIARIGPEMTHAVAHMARLSNGHTAHLLFNPCWHLPTRIDEVLELRRMAFRDHPNIHFTILSATADDEVILREAGLDSIWCNHNALVDERQFFPEPAQKRFDAIYNGRLTPFKRHELAFEVPRMAVISHCYEFEDPYGDQAVKGYRDLIYCHIARNEAQLLKAPQVRELLNQAHCGLALSAIEGAMFASIEYLLSGLPVVTTPSLGGRDVFFHEDYVAQVEETPQAVAAAVAKFKQASLDPMMIRRRTLELVRAHRARLLMRLSGLTQRNLFAEADENLWLPFIASRPGPWIRAPR